MLAFKQEALEGESEQVRAVRKYGLIAEKDLSLFELPEHDEGELPLFDQLCELSDHGWITFRDRTMRVDHYMEEGNEVRSVLEVTSQTGVRINVATSNLIHTGDKYLLEVHPSSIDPSTGIISEPEVGSPDVVPGPSNAYVIHYQVAYEATPLPIEAIPFISLPPAA